jgi:hypothetical protein
MLLVSGGSSPVSADRLVIWRVSRGGFCTTRGDLSEQCRSCIHTTSVRRRKARYILSPPSFKKFPPVFASVRDFGGGWLTSAGACWRHGCADSRAPPEPLSSHVHDLAGRVGDGRGWPSLARAATSTPQSPQPRLPASTGAMPAPCRRHASAVPSHDSAMIAPPRPPTPALLARLPMPRFPPALPAHG